MTNAELMREFESKYPPGTEFFLAKMVEDSELLLRRCFYGDSEPPLIFFDNEDDTNSILNFPLRTFLTRSQKEKWDAFREAGFAHPKT